jgi:hypothetical protein
MTLCKSSIKRRPYKRGFPLTSTLKYLWIIGLSLTLGLSCTIRDDNGNPVKTGPITTDQDSDTVSIVTPALFASPESAYVKIKDTMVIRISVIADSSLKDSITPLPYVVVKASISKGRLLKDSITVDRNGRGRFYFTDTASGRVEMTVTCNGAQQTIRFDVSNSPQVQKLIEIIPEKSVILADGKDSTTISVSIINTDHNPIAGECVQFISSAGTIIGNSTACGSGQGITGTDGKATATLVSSNINDTAYITAYLVSDRSLSDEAEVEFKGVSIKISSNATNLVINDTAVITATVLNASGVPVSKAPIYFSLSDATKSNLQILSADSVTNYDGVATVRVKAKTNGFDAISIVSSGASGSLQLNVSTLSLKMDLNKTVIQTMETDSAIITTTFTNSSGSPLDNRTVKLTKTYKTEAGSDTTETLTKSTNATGKATFTVVAISYEGSMKLEAIAFDKTEGYASVDTTIQFITTRVMTIRAPEFVAADGSSKGPVTVSIKNRSGNPIIDDAVLFSTTAGTITGKVKTDAEGKAVAYITSDRRNMIATVTARLESDLKKFQTIDVLFSGVEILASAQPPSISSNGKDTSTIIAILTDAAKNPIAGEPVNFSKQKDATLIVFADQITNNRGEARCKIVGTGVGIDTIQISAAGVTTPVLLYYSSNILKIDTLPGQSFIANGKDSTVFEVTYLKGDKVTAIPNASVEINFTVGTTNDTLFAKNLTTNASGKVRFAIHNPEFAVSATVSGLARSGTEISSYIMNIYFKANKVYEIKLTGTSEVVNVNGDRSKILATAFDSLGNRVKDARITFNLLAGPSGGEYLDPPYATTGDDGVATTNFVSGKTPSAFREVWITAGDFSSIRSDTLKFTIAGPPKYITIRTNLLKGKNPNDGTFILPCAAIVTDVNGNPVADGTDVTFSLQISGYVVSELSSHVESATSTGGLACNSYLDTIYTTLPFEDFNDNLKLDPGEDRNGDGILNRGEDLNGDGIYDRGPAFIDINQNGKRDYNFKTLSVEKTYTCGGNTVYFSDLNHNNHWDPIEPLDNPTYLAAYQRLQADLAFYSYPTISNASDSADFAILRAQDSAYESLPGFIRSKGCFDMDNDWNGIRDPNTAVAIKKVVQTQGGKALNEVLYGQTDASRIEVMIWAESQGVRTLTPEKFVLPIVKDEE